MAFTQHRRGGGAWRKGWRKVSNAATMPPMPPMPPCRHNAANNAATMPPESYKCISLMPQCCQCRQQCRQTMPPCRHNAARQCRHAANAANHAAMPPQCRHNAAKPSGGIANLAPVHFLFYHFVVSTSLQFLPFLSFYMFALFTILSFHLFAVLPFCRFTILPFYHLRLLFGTILPLYLFLFATLCLQTFLYLLACL